MPVPIEEKRARRRALRGSLCAALAAAVLMACSDEGSNAPGVMLVGDSPGAASASPMMAGMGAPMTPAATPAPTLPMASSMASGIAAAPATEGAAGAPAMDPMGMAEPTEMPPEVVMRADQGEGDGSDVIAIGDSWMNLFSGGIQQSLVRTSGQPYRTYGVPGTRLLSEQIPGQYTRAKGENPDIATVVMTGGGNDIIQVPGLREDCDAGGELCGTEVGKILDRLTSLWEEMAADGVQDVVYVQYSDTELNDVDFELPDGDSATVRCAAVPEPLRCHTLPTADLVMGDIPDGIHPSSAGYDRIGAAVHELMIERGMRR